jgi:carbon monoxide dehydrogenase subunit G
VELEHRFEVPVGVDTAYATLLDMNKVGPCFPGATLESVDGDDFTGSVKVKLGPIQLTYKGKASIVEKDPVRHTAKIEATGSAARSSSTAAMMVTASATPLAPNRTQVDLVTTLSITGRPAQFGRGVMVEVGNKLIGQFADCVADQLTGTTVGGAELIEVENPDEVAAEITDPASFAERAPAPAAVGSAAVGAHRTPLVRSAQPVDLLETAGAPILKRVVPLILAIVALVLLRKILKGKSAATESGG